uniref:Glucagon / GIP / secretin / VIP family domain-containing protein n=1 Tax=Oncorhynchus tshawytscha TaxID=74940 RepID=A0A8C8JNW2_ONCTS
VVCVVYPSLSDIVLGRLINCGPSSFLVSPRCHTYELERGPNGINSFKRHSDGTFTNDYTHSLDKIKAKEFVQWLASTKRER